MVHDSGIPMTTGAKPVKARHIPIRPDWLALRVEEAAEPDLPIIDAHHHLWNKPESPYLGHDMEADIRGGHNVRGTIFVEGRWGYREEGDPALRSLGETEMVAAIAEECARGPAQRPRIASAIVGRVELSLGDRAGDVLDRHIEAGGGRFRGVRNTSAWHEDPEARGSVVLPPRHLLADSAFRAGFAQLARRELIFDAWMYHTQLGELVDLARVFPDATIVLDHIGGPIGIGPYAGRRAEVFDAWREAVRKVAECANVAVKLGGLGMLMSGFDFQDRSLPPTSDDLAQAWGPYFETCIDLFGPRRCMFESNFPVDKGTSAYTVVWNAFKKVSRPYSRSERLDLFHETARRTYGPDLPPAAEVAGARPRDHT